MTPSLQCCRNLERSPTRDCCDNCDIIHFRGGEKEYFIASTYVLIKTFYKLSPRFLKMTTFKAKILILGIKNQYFIDS